MQRCFGYSLTGDVFEQVFFLCYGDGANGKSVLLKTLKNLVGSYGINLRAETLMTSQLAQASNEIARLTGARVATVSEVGNKNRLNESLLKDITGGDPVTARYLYKEAFDFYPQAKIWMQGNYLPDIRGQDHGIWRRVLIIPFRRQFDKNECDPDLLRSLRNERSGILNWAIAGCASWQENGLRPPSSVLDTVSEYKQEMNSVSRFLGDCTVVTEEPKTGSQQLFHAYQAWCKEKGVHGLGTVRAFGIEMKKNHGDLRKQVSKGIFFRLSLEADPSGGY